MNWFELQSGDINSLQRGRNGVVKGVDFRIRQPEYKTCPVALSAQFPQQSMTERTLWGKGRMRQIAK